MVFMGVIALCKSYHPRLLITMMTTMTPMMISSGIPIASPSLKPDQPPVRGGL
jgi:hypothetical protein